jgi:hypothetical protein
MLFHAMHISSPLTESTQFDIDLHHHRIYLVMKTDEKQTHKIDGQFDLLNQSPELYESRSNDLDRNMSSPAWKNGMPWYVTQ